MSVPRVTLVLIAYAMLAVAAAVLWLGLHHGDIAGLLIGFGSAAILAAGAKVLFHHDD